MLLNTTGLGIGVIPSSNLHVNGNALVSKQIFVGGTSGSANLHITGSLGFSHQTMSSNTTLGSSSYVFVNSATDNITLTLPYAANVTGREYTIKKTSLLNNIWITGGGNVIGDANPIELPSHSTRLPCVTVMSASDQWYVKKSYSVNDTVSASNLIGWWKLDETSGTVITDSSTNANHGSLDTYTSVPGKVNKAINLGGTTQVEMTDASESLYDLTTAITLSCWFTVDTFDAQWQSLFTKGDTSWRLAREDTSNFLSFTLNEWPNDKSVTSTTDVNDGDWHHVAGVYDGATMNIYIDGVLEDTLAFAGNINNNTYPLRIGENDQNWNRKWKGSIDDVRVYDAALDAGQVHALYQGGN
ncbi:MAG: LamG domain-containing protein [Planctomycetes bacterium]|nr:LamG domain-containing protein [Planctomycetota bacterium]